MNAKNAIIIKCNIWRSPHRSRPSLWTQYLRLHQHLGTNEDEEDYTDYIDGNNHYNTSDIDITGRMDNIEYTDNGKFVGNSDLDVAWSVDRFYSTFHQYGTRIVPEMNESTIILSDLSSHVSDFVNFCLLQTFSTNIQGSLYKLLLQYAPTVESGAIHYHDLFPTFHSFNKYVHDIRCYSLFK